MSCLPWPSEEKFLGRVLRDREDELSFSLCREDPVELSKNFFERSIISSESYNHFISMDHSRIKSRLRVRYLVRLVSEKIKKNPTLWENLIAVLDTLEGVPSSLTDKLKQAVLKTNEGPADDSEAVRGVSGESLGEASGNEDVVLTSADVNLLTELLVEVSDVWFNIAISLGLPQPEIKNCKGEDNKISLFQTMWFWIANNSEPTLKKLTDTLCSEIVARTAVAEKITRKFMEAKRMSKGNSKRNYLAKSKSHKSTITPTTPRIVSQCLPTEVADGKSTLLQVQASPKESVSYQWKKDDQPLANSSRYSGVDEDILVVRHACQGTEGEYTCQVSLRDKQVSSEPITLTVHFPPAKEHLLNLYSAISEVPSPKGSWPPVVAKSFINLALIKSRGVPKVSGDYSVRGDADDIIAEKENITYKDAFSEYQSGELILVEGRPGSGKTTLVHKIIKDWRLGKVLTKSELTFLVTLRLLNNKKQDESLINIFQDFYSDPNELGKVISVIMKQDGNGICFVLDGLDEYCSREKSVIQKLLDRKLLPQSTLIVFSRPSATELVKKDCIHKRIEVFGFRKEQISEYIDNFSFELGDGSIDNSVIKANQLKEYLHCHPNIHDMCYLPIHAAMICFLFQLSKKLSPTQTRVYEDFTLCIIYRLLVSQESCLALNSLKDLKGAHAQYFKDLCHLAYEMTVKYKQVINSQQLEDRLGGRGSFSEEAGLGLLTICPTLQKTGIHQNYAFLHLTFQEFLAAYYLANYLDESQQIQLLRNFSRHMINVWLFYSGLVNFVRSKQILQPLFQSLYRYELFHCALESQQKYVCNELIMYYSKKLQLGSSPSPLDLIALEYVITSSSHCITRLEIDYGHRYDVTSLMHKVVKADLHQLQNVSVSLYYTDKCKIESTDIFCALLKKSINLKTLCLSVKSELSSVKLMAEVIDHFTKLPHLDILYSGSPHCMGKFINDITSPHVSEYSISFNSLNIPSGDKMRHLHSNNLLNLEAVITIKDYDIKKLPGNQPQKIHNCVFLRYRLSYSDIHNSGLACLSRKHSDLQLLGLDISGKVINFHVAKELKLLTALQNLSLSENNIGCDGATSLAAGFKFLTVLQDLDLSENKIGYDGATSLAAGFKFLTALQKLDLCRNKIGSDGATMLAGGFKFFTTLLELNLSFNDIGSDGVIALSSGFKFLTALQKLDLSSNNIGPDGATTIAGGFKIFTGLQELTLNHCHIGPDGAIALTSGLKWLTALRELNLKNNNVGPDGVTSLVGEFKALTALQRIDLSFNNIGSEGATALAGGFSFLTELRRCNLSDNNINQAGFEAVIVSLKECDFLDCFSINDSNSLLTCKIIIHDIIADTATISYLSEAAQHESKERTLDLYL